MISFIIQSPVNGAHAGHRVAVTHSLRQQSVPDFPGEHGGILSLVICDFIHNFRGGHLGLGATDHSRLDAACLVISGREYNMFSHYFRLGCHPKTSVPTLKKLTLT